MDKAVAETPVAIIKDRPLFEMSFRKHKAERIVSGSAHQINLNALRLMAFDAPHKARQHWKRELRSSIGLLAAIKLKPNYKPLSEKRAYRWLYKELFGGNELSITHHFLNILTADDHHRNEDDVSTVAERLKTFNADLAKRISTNDPALDLIEAL